MVSWNDNNFGKSPLIHRFLLGIDRLDIVILIFSGGQILQEFFQPALPGEAQVRLNSLSQAVSMEFVTTRGK